MKIFNSDTFPHIKIVAEKILTGKISAYKREQK